MSCDAGEVLLSQAAAGAFPCCSVVWVFFPCAAATAESQNSFPSSGGCTFSLTVNELFMVLGLLLLECVHIFKTFVISCLNCMC